MAMGGELSIAGKSCDDIGKQQVFELHDAVLEREFALFEALDQHHVADACRGQRGNGGIEIGVFLAPGGEFETEPRFLILGQRQHAPVQPEMPVTPDTWLTDRPIKCTEYPHNGKLAVDKA